MVRNVIQRRSDNVLFFLLFWYTRQINLSNSFMSSSVCVLADPKLVSAEIVVSGAFANGFQNDSFPFPSSHTLKWHGTLLGCCSCIQIRCVPPCKCASVQWIVGTEMCSCNGDETCFDNVNPKWHLGVQSAPHDRFLGYYYVIITIAAVIL